MNHSGDAAEQIVRMSLEGVEVAARITGTAAKEIALLLIAALKNEKGNLKLKGRARLISMLKSGKPLEIFSVKESDLKQFMQGAKEYGIVYCVLRNAKNSPDGLCDIMVKADDAPKISRLAERFKFATVNKSEIESEIVAERAARPKRDAPDAGDTDKLLDELLGADEDKAEPVAPESGKTGSLKPESVKDNRANAEAVKAEMEPAAGNPFFQAGPQTPPLSEPFSNRQKMQERTVLSRPSVREELREISAARKAKEADAPVRDERRETDKLKSPPAVTTHNQPQHGKNKSKKQRGSR